MTDNWKNQKKASSPLTESDEHDEYDLPGTPPSHIEELLKIQEPLIKLFMEYVIVSITSRIDGLVRDVDDLEATSH